jgi:hypothetical protein
MRAAPAHRDTLEPETKFQLAKRNGGYGVQSLVVPRCPSPQFGNSEFAPENASDFLPVSGMWEQRDLTAEQKAPKSRVFLRLCHSDPHMSDWLADAPVQFEPVSAPNSPLTGKNKGNSTNPNPRHQRKSTFRPLKRGLLLTIPYPRKHGICQRQTGKTNSVTGNF